MSALKSKFISLYITLLFVGSGHIGYQLVEIAPGNAAWLGAAAAVWPATLLFMKIFVFKTARTVENFYGIIGLSIMGAAITVYYVLTTEVPGAGFALAYSVGLGLGGFWLYNFWYSRFGREDNEQLQVGKPLPEFILEDAQGKEVSSNSFQGKPALYIFYRGNWCPLCMAQIKEVAGAYKELAERGVSVNLVSPQSHSNTESLANKFDVPFNFLVDKDNRAATQLDIVSIGGTPTGMEVLGYDSDTVMPTVLITDETGKLIFADLTDNYRVRPEPETFIKVLDDNNVVAASQESALCFIANRVRNKKGAS